MSDTARWFPEQPPHLPGEAAAAYTDRLTGADRTDRIPYDHPRNRQCSIGWHAECSDPAGTSCKCPCHTEAGKLALRLHEIEETAVALYGVAAGLLPEGKTPGWGARITDGEGGRIADICARRPVLAEWYLGTKEAPGAPR
jgi:hypothetical protein